MPWVGSSKMKTSAPAVEPLRQHDLLLVAAREVTDRVLGVGDLDAAAARPARCAASPLAPARSGSGRAGATRKRRSDGQRDVLADRERRGPRPGCCGPRAAARCPRRIASRGAADLAALAPRIRTSPEAARSAPKISRTSSVRPAPTSPAMPSMSPACSEKLDVLDDAGTVRPSTRSSSSRGVPAGAACQRSAARPRARWPVMCSISSAPRRRRPSAPRRPSARRASRPRRR